METEMAVSPAVTIELLGTQRAVAGIDCIDMPIGEGTTAKEVFYFLKTNFPEMDLDEQKLLLAISHEVVSPERVLKANETVFLVPHIGGG
jgi:hypothetical protein